MPSLSARFNRIKASVGGQDRDASQPADDSPNSSPAPSQSSARSPLPRSPDPSYQDVLDDRYMQQPPRHPDAPESYYTESQAGHLAQSLEDPEDQADDVSEPIGFPYQPGSGPPPQQQAAEPKKTKKGFFGLGGHSKENARQSLPGSASGSQGGLGRSASVRQKEGLQGLRAKGTGQHHPHFHWASARSSKSNLSAPGEEGTNELDPYLIQNEDDTPPPPLKDPAGPPGHEEDHLDNSRLRGNLPRMNTDSTVARDSPREDFARPQRQQSLHHAAQFPSPPPQGVQYQAYQPMANNGNIPRAPDGSPVGPYPQMHDGQPPRPSSRQQYPPSPLAPQPGQQYQTYNPETASVSSRTSMHGPPVHQSQGSMAIPSATSSQSRRSMEFNAASQQAGPPMQVHGPNVMVTNQPPTPGAAQLRGQGPQQGQSYRGPPPPQQQQAQQQQQQIQGPGDVGRNTPPPGVDVNHVMAKYEELEAKYKKVKRQYFDRDAQVQQLQNTIAHQRLSVSRNSLDDSEYAKRFERLDGLINNLSFTIRKDWKFVPAWLEQGLNQDAHKVGKQEMTAVGRACISRWVVEEIFDRYFHPGLEPTLGVQLKNIEKNIRLFAPTTQTKDEEEALQSKISVWRLTTLEGLQQMLASPQSTDYRAQLLDTLTEELREQLQAQLNDPPPAGLEAGVNMIVELALGIAYHLPLESRNVHVHYFLPGTLVSTDLMRIESGLPALTNPGASSDGAKQGDVSMTGVQDSSSQTDKSESPAEQSGEEQEQTAKKLPEGSSQQSGNAPSKPGNSGQRDASGPQRVRLSTSMAVEVRGKSVLVKASVYT